MFAVFQPSFLTPNELDLCYVMVKAMYRVGEHTHRNNMLDSGTFAHQLSIQLPAYFVMLHQ